MTLLTDTSLQSLIDSTPSKDSTTNKLHIFPYSDSSLTPLGYDIRIGTSYSISNSAKMTYLKDGESFRLSGGETVFIKSLERITMPSDHTLSGLVVSKVSITAKGLVNATTTIDPDWDGNLLLVFHNQSKHEVILKQGMEICTAVFLNNSQRSTRNSGKDDGRNSLLVDHWNELNSRSNKLGRLFSILRPGVVLISFAIGNQLFGSSPGLVAAVAVGVALSQLIPTRE